MKHFMKFVDNSDLRDYLKSELVCDTGNYSFYKDASVIQQDLIL